MATLEQTFHSLHDFLDHVNGKPLCPEYLGPTYDDSGEWFGVTKDKQVGEYAGRAVFRIAHDGWPRGLKLMEQVQASVDAPRAKSIRRRMRWSDQGDEVNMQRVYAGNLDQAWNTTTRQLSHGPSRVRIIVDSIAWAMQKSDEMRWRGIAAMKLADILTQAGYTVQVESAFYGEGGGYGALKHGKRVLRVIVKPYSAPLDLESLAATTALPGFFRALGHAWAGGGMSVPRLELSHVHDESDKAFAVIIPQSVCSAETACTMVNEVLGQLEPKEEYVN